jgi:hypothetical protein
MPCVDQSEINEGSPPGLVLPLASEMQNNCILFFPVSKEVGSLINFLLEAEETEDQQLNMIEVFKTMINTWKSGGRFLSGIFIDKIFDPDSEEDIINVNLVLSSTSNGYIEAVIKVCFVHAIIVAVMEDVDIMISEELLSKLLPEDKIEGLEDEDGDDEEESKDPFSNSNIPRDENILNIAKQIMSGKIK